MYLKKVIIVGAAVAMIAGSLLTVSAAEPSTGKYVKALKASGKDNLIIDVEAYKAAYSDLEKAFGDDENAYIEHYLTIGVFEGRTKGVLFDPLAYAAAYSDVRAAFGNDISAIVDHYINFGVAENRTLGTANGYADIATAQKSGSPIIVVQRNIYNTNAAADNGGADAAEITDSNIPTSSNIPTGSNIPASNNIPTGSNIPASSNIPTGSNNWESGVVANANNNSAALAASNAPTVSDSTNNPESNRHSTSIYENSSDGGALIRVEYYDDNNHLYEYSDVKDYDESTKSYTEIVYQYDEESQTEVVTRTDTYENGQLVSSVTP